jgi:hypothetical protein
VRAHGSMLSSVATFAKNERRAVVAELAEMMEHERDVRASATLATSACLADPSASDPLQRVAAEDAAPITALVAPGPRLRRVLEAVSFQDGDVRAAWCAADAGGSSHALHLRRLPGRCVELVSSALGAVDDDLGRLVLVGGQLGAPAALAGGLAAAALDACQSLRQIAVHFRPIFALRSPYRSCRQCGDRRARGRASSPVLGRCACERSR